MWLGSDFICVVLPSETTDEVLRDWTTPYILNTSKPATPLDADKTWLAKAARYTMVGDDLYKREYGQPLLKCVTAEQA